MGREKHLKKVEELFKKSPVVSYRSIERIVKDRKDSGYTKQLIRNLILKGKIKRLARGYYTYSDDSSLAVFCFKPSYLGLQDAMSTHNIWEQETIPVIITARKVRQGLRNIIGGNVLIRRIENKYLFGIEYIEKDGFWMPYSDIEKTFIDMVYFKEKMSDDALKIIQKKINKKKLEGYLKKYPKRINKIITNLI